MSSNYEGRQWLWFLVPHFIASETLTLWFPGYFMTYLVWMETKDGKMVWCTKSFICFSSECFFILEEAWKVWIMVTWERFIRDVLLHHLTANLHIPSSVVPVKRGNFGEGSKSNLKELFEHVFILQIIAIFRIVNVDMNCTSHSGQGILSFVQSLRNVMAVFKSNFISKPRYVVPCFSKFLPVHFWRFQIRSKWRYF